MVTTYKQRQIEFAINAIITAGPDEMDVKQACCDAAACGASRRQIGSALSRRKSMVPPFPAGKDPQENCSGSRLT